MTLTHSLPLSASDIISAEVPKARLTDGVLTHKRRQFASLFVCAFKSTRKPNEPRRKFLLAASQVVTTTMAASIFSSPHSSSRSPSDFLVNGAFHLAHADDDDDDDSCPDDDRRCLSAAPGQCCFCRRRRRRRRKRSGGGGRARTQARAHGELSERLLTPRQSDFTAFRQDDARQNSCRLETIIASDASGRLFPAVSSRRFYKYI